MFGWPGDGRDGHALYLLYRYIFLYPCRELLVLTITTVTVPRPDANRVRGCGDSMPDTAFRTLWSPPICTVLESSSSHPTEKRWLFWLPFTEKKLLNIRPRGRGKIRCFSNIFLSALHSTEKHGPFWAGVFRYTEKNMPFWPVLFYNFFSFIHHTEKHRPFW